MRVEPYRQDHHGQGRCWPPPAFAQTLVSRTRLDNVHHCIETVLGENVPGDFIEAGVWRGGVGILMRAVLAANHIDDRTVWLADSFAGLPAPNPSAYPADRDADFHEYDELAVPIDVVKDAFRRYGLLDEHVEFVPGWFNQTLPKLRNHRWALVRVDADMYESTSDALAYLYPGLASGGFVIIDDYVHEPCRRAVEDFRTSFGIEDEIHRIDWAAAYWRRSATLDESAPGNEQPRSGGGLDSQDGA